MRALQWEIAAALLAGGAGSRVNGLRKGLLRLPDGACILERTIRAVVQSGIGEVAIFANDPEPYVRSGREIVPDHHPGNGPLGGIETALMHYSGRCEGVLVLPCDLPGITAREISTLIQAFVEHSPPGPGIAAGMPFAPAQDEPRHARPTRAAVVAETEGGFWQPLCAIVRVDMLAAVSQALEEGRRGVYRLWREVGALPVRFEDSRPFFNINTPADLTQWVLTEQEPNDRAGNLLAEQPRCLRSST